MSAVIKIYKSGFHSGEESLVLGNDRSGMITFSGCLLSCRFCYTPETSRLKLGKDYSEQEFYQLLFQLVEKGAKNINLITPSHIWSKLEAPIAEFKKVTENKVPLILKVGGSESLSLIQRMLRLGDLWVADFKVWSSQVALEENLPPQYGVRTLAGIEFAAQKLSNEYDPVSGLLKRGVLVRHLMMPNCEGDTEAVIDQLKQIRFSGYLNLMTWFIHPEGKGLTRAPLEQIQKVLNQISNAFSVLVDGRLIPHTGGLK